MFGAIRPARGVGAALAMPFADTEAMLRRLEEISRHVAEGDQAVLLLDPAGTQTTNSKSPATSLRFFCPRAHQN